MELLDFQALEARADEWDALVSRSPEIDRFCTSSAWISPARASFCPGARPCIARRDDSAVALMIVPIGIRRFGGLPMEAGWGLAAPFAGPDPDAVVGLLADVWAMPPSRMDGLFLSGIPPEGRWMRALIHRFAHHRIGLGERCVRRQADIGDGMDGFFARRSTKFRATLRRAVRKGAASGVVYERVDEGPLDAVFDRILAVEVQSWKGRDGAGIDHEPSSGFYRRVLHRLIDRRALRVVFARLDGHDIGYVFGGVMGATYRGLQVSFDDAFAHLAPGNLVQHAMIEWLIEDGITTYDLGTDMPYKQRWAERCMETVTVAILPRSQGFARFFAG